MCEGIWASVEGCNSENVCMSDSSGAAEKHCDDCNLYDLHPLF